MVSEKYKIKGIAQAIKKGLVSVQKTGPENTKTPFKSFCEDRTEMGREICTKIFHSLLTR